VRFEGTNYTRANFANYQAAASPHDANSLAQNPSFTNAGGSYALDTDFQLQSGSPCLNAGADLGLTDDYAGKPRPVGSGPDLGAYEYQ
jgi:hypothetical protein